MTAGHLSSLTLPPLPAPTAAGDGSPARSPSRLSGGDCGGRQVVKGCEEREARLLDENQGLREVHGIE